MACGGAGPGGWGLDERAAVGAAAVGKDCWETALKEKNAHYQLSFSVVALS